VLVTQPGGALTAVRGGPFLHQAAAGRTWRVSAGVFWQVHPAAADVLAEAVLGTLQPRNGEVALDLYCGAGLFTGLLAEAVGPGGTVIGIESDPAAVRDARHNLRATPWARVHRGDAAEVLARPEPVDADIAVLDPPRPGACWTGCWPAAACAGSRTCPATRPRWPGTSRCCGPRAGSWASSARSTRSR
jgi:tRNA/tmRNA/rRNA uracil-C5-methylase (TrmA/RlmC/RlmD family)